ncbi:MAG: hypothetical protein GYB33_11250 [Gammaproteobacteria bacterium]|nr:hypothetical protein [Gammaproteobacteria bacterium]
MDTIIKILEVLLSWQTVAIVALILLLSPIKNLIHRLIEGDSGEAKVGPVEIKLGKIVEDGEKAVDDLNRINYIMAESRRLELEITLRMSEVYGALGMNVMTGVQLDEMHKHIKELKIITETSVDK